jgi:phage terminase large subunit-like protein
MPVQTANNRISNADAILLAVDAEECRRSLKRFKRAVWHIIEPADYVDGWCQDALDEHLEAVTRGAIRKLVINIPPRHTKSTELVIWRAWLWTQDPQAQILSASYALSLSIRDNLKVRRILEDPWFTDRYGKELQVIDARVEMAHDNNQKMHYENTRGGFQKAVSVGGSATGHGGGYLIIDDLHNATEAHSDLNRDNAVTWFREVWTNRQNNQETGRSVVVGQRIHEADVCGYILKERPDYEHLNLPAEYEPARACFTSIGWRDPRMQEGDLLWPERFSAASLSGLKRDLGSTGYAAQYQQTPVPASGGQFKEKWFRYFSMSGDYYLLQTPQGNKSVPIKDCWRFTVVDLAISTKQSADFTVIQTYDVTPQNDLLLIDQIRGHFDNPEQQKIIRATYFRLRPQFVQVETVAYQLAIVQQLRDEPVSAMPMESNPVRVGDFLVRVGSAEALDQTLQSLPGMRACVLQDDSGKYVTYRGGNIVRVEGDIYFFRFACEQQGYCEIVHDILEQDVLAIQQEAKRKYSIPLREYKPVRDKVSRASTPAILMENGKFYFYEKLPDLPEIKAEFLHFPKAAHDDIVDTGSQAAEIVTMPTGPLMWSPDSLPVPEHEQLPPMKAQSGLVSVDWGKGGKSGLDDLAWNFDAGEMHEYETGGRW